MSQELKLPVNEANLLCSYLLYSALLPSALLCFAGHSSALLCLALLCSPPLLTNLVLYSDFICSAQLWSVLHNINVVWSAIIKEKKNFPSFYFSSEQLTFPEQKQLSQMFSLRKPSRKKVRNFGHCPNLRDPPPPHAGMDVKSLDAQTPTVVCTF